MSTMISKIGFLSLASTALAAPFQPSGYAYPYPVPSGSGTGYPSGTGAPYPAGNGTGPYGSGTGTGTVGSTGYSYATAYATVTVTAGATTDIAAADASSSSCSTPIVYETTTEVQYLTVTPSGGAWWSVPSVATPSDYPVAASSSVAAVASSAKPSSVEAAAAGYADFSYPWSRHHSSAKSTPETSEAPVPTPTPTSTTPAAPVETSTTPVAPAETSTTPVATSSSAAAIVSLPVSLPSLELPSVIPSSSSAAPETTSTYVAPSPSTTSVAPVAPSATSAAPKPSATYSGGSSSGASTKRGVPYNDASMAGAFSGSKVSWAYNWASHSDGLSDDFDYVPMLWSNRADFLSDWEENAKSAIASGSTHLLGFNEPDLPAQANMLPGIAATAYKTLITDVFGGQAKLGSPAVTNGGGDSGLTWLSTFLDGCSDCQIDFVALHWYDSYQNTEYFKSHVTQAHEQTGKPVWVTEFGCTDGDDSQISGFLEEVMGWMDQQDFVERYSYFMASDGKLNSGSGLSSYGQTYADYSA